MFPRVTHPSATPPCEGVRLACVKPAASVRSEPGSNSQVVAQDLVPTSHNPGRTLARPSRRVPNTSVTPSQSRKRRDESENVTVGAVLSQRLSTPCRPSKASRKDPAVHVSLPSDEIVKQRGGARKHPPKRKPYTTGYRRRQSNPANPARSKTQAKLRKSPSRNAVSTAPLVDEHHIVPQTPTRQPGSSQNGQKNRPPLQRCCRPPAGRARAPADAAARQNADPETSAADAAEVGDPEHRPTEGRQQPQPIHPQRGIVGIDGDALEEPVDRRAERRQCPHGAL